MITKLWTHLSKRRHKQYGLLLILMIISSVSEVVSVGAVIPFLGALTAPEQIYQSPLMQPIIELFQITAPKELILPLTVTFIIAALLAASIRLILLYVMTRLSFATGADLCIDIYRKTLYQDYSVHVSRNSSEVINGVINKTGMAVNIIHCYLKLGSSTILIISILITLFVIDTTTALVASIGFGVLYWIVIVYTRRQLKLNSQCIAEESTKIIKSLQEGLGGIRDVIIDGKQQFYCQLFRSHDLPHRRAIVNNAIIGSSPRYVMEAVGMTLIAGLAYAISLRNNGLITAIPTLGALALGAQRLIPALQQAYGSYSVIKGGEASFKDVLDLLNQPLPNYIEQPQPPLQPIEFNKDITINNLSFRYTEETSWILKGINLKIKKGDRIGFIGKTGSGKSTLIDIIMGLLSPTEGSLSIDNRIITTNNCRSWQLHIAHVSQNVFLSDNTIEENIAFGMPSELIDRQLVKKAAKQAQLNELIEGSSNQYNTLLGERGIRLSGGQRQRIGIARALYKKADVLIFDEATSALDNSTERAVMEAIDGLEGDLTILIIAHRLTTLKGCDQIIDLSNKKVTITNSEAVNNLGDQ